MREIYCTVGKFFLHVVGKMLHVILSVAQRLVADADRERSDAGTVPKVNTCMNVCFRCVKRPVLKTKALTPDLFFLGAAGSQNIVHKKLHGQ